MINKANKNRILWYVLWWKVSKHFCRNNPKATDVWKLRRLQRSFISLRIQIHFWWNIIIQHDDATSESPVHNKLKQKSVSNFFFLGLTSNVLNLPYLIFVISFTQAGFWKTKFYTQKTTKGTKNTKNVSEKVKYMHFFTQFGKIYTWQKIFTQAPPVVPVTNMRYATDLLK